MSGKCFYCERPSEHMRFLGVPGHIMVPNSYLVCDDHKDKFLKFEDIYNEDGSRKPCPTTPA